MTPVTEWLALLRAHEGGVTRQRGCYLNHGRSMAKYVADALDELLDAELLVLAPAKEHGQQKVLVTVQAQARYAELCHSQGRTRGSAHA